MHIDSINKQSKTKKDDIEYKVIINELHLGKTILPKFTKSQNSNDF